MGQEVGQQHFHQHDFQQFEGCLQQETAYLRGLMAGHQLSSHAGKIGFELEATLTDKAGLPAPGNAALIDHCPELTLNTELARFNVEFNSPVYALKGDALGTMHAGLYKDWQQASLAAEQMDMQLLMIGILPSLRMAHLGLEFMSPMQRYRALNEQVLRMRHGQSLHLHIEGEESLGFDHRNVMIESVTTSFQLHWQVPFRQAHHYMNSMLMLSGPLLAAAVNSPVLFGRRLWQETRIPVFEQAISFASPSGLPRVGFAPRYLQSSLMECFEENLREHAVLLPAVSEKPVSRMHHLRLHNGTVWRWCRPLVGFDDDGMVHLRLEQRILPAGPSCVDMVANAALLFGLTQALVEQLPDIESQLSFQSVRDNFYRCARYGLEAPVQWLDGKMHSVQSLLLQSLLPMAGQGLAGLGCTDYQRWLDILHQRVASGRTGAHWQTRWLQQNAGDAAGMVLAYYQHQQSDLPVHEWSML